ncbi:MAG: O-methyltransferase, partial [Acidimicrobiales bacterium]
MSDVRALTVTAELVDYAVAHGSDVPDPVLDDLRAETAALGPPAGMQVGPDEGQLLTLLTRLVDARRAVEVGSFTGYSSLCIARGLAPGGTLLCCDVSEEWAAIAWRAWDRAGLADTIELRIAPAIETLRSLPAEPHIDLAFIDADKGGYVAYWDELVPRVRPGGLLLADNVLWS